MMSRHYMYISLKPETDNECRRENESRDDAELYRLRVQCSFDIQCNIYQLRMKTPLRGLSLQLFFGRLKPGLRDET